MEEPETELELLVVVVVVLWELSVCELLRGLELPLL